MATEHSNFTNLSINNVHHATNECQLFNINELCKGSNSVICGKRLVGKSTLLTDIIQSRQNAKVVIFASKYVAPSYKKFFPPECVFEYYDPKILKNLINNQQKNPDKELVLGFDDIKNMVNKDVWNDAAIRDVIRYGSSLGITAIFSIQYAGQLDDMFKRNIDYVFCFRDNIIENQKLLFTEFGGMFPTFKDFKAVHDGCIAEPYRCLVFDLKTPRKNPRQSVFWYKASQNLQRYVPPTQKEKPWYSKLSFDSKSFFRW